MNVPAGQVPVSLLVAGPERAAEIATIHAGLFDPPWKEADVLALLQQPTALTFVAVVKAPAAPSGFVLTQVVDEEAEILSIGVVAARQRSGLAKALLEGLLRAYRRIGVTRVFLEVADDNVAARALYAKLGFREIGRRKAYYTRASGAVDAINLELSI